MLLNLFDIRNILGVSQRLCWLKECELEVIKYSILYVWTHSSSYPHLKKLITCVKTLKLVAIISKCYYFFLIEVTFQNCFHELNMGQTHICFLHHIFTKIKLYVKYFKNHSLLKAQLELEDITKSFRCIYISYLCRL